MKYKYIILFLIILIIYFLFYKNESYEVQKKDYDIIISINVHEKITFLLKQLDNIKENVKCNYAVLLNCNDYMYNECKIISLPENVYINDEIINKQHDHGSLTHGVYSNIKYSLEYFTFKYLIVSSSRNFFDNSMRLEDLDKVVSLGPQYDINDVIEEYNDWHWPIFKGTLLAQHFLNNKKKLYASAHEGLMFTYNGCEKIVEFLESNPEIKDDLFNFHKCVEEFALQSIVVNMGEQFYYIGNGCCTEQTLAPNDSSNLKFLYKVRREGNSSFGNFMKCRA
jgi:hypothetical protein